MAEKIKLKVCGMREEKNILDVAQLQPHFMGFIFYGDSPRYVGPDFKTPVTFPDTTRRVGVFVNESPEVMLKTVQLHHLDYVQLHGDESVAACAEMKSRGIGIIKVFSVDDETDFKVTEKYREVSDFFLFDTRGKFYGGNAKTFNWDVLHRYDQKIPFFLSGGITADHVESIKRLKDFNLYAIDVNSGVEIRSGYKDVNKIKLIRDILLAKT